MAVFLRETFETYGAPLHSRTAIDGYASLYGWARVPPSNPAFTTNYPGIYEAAYLNVLAGAGKNGSYGLGWVDFPVGESSWYDGFLVRTVMGGASVPEFVLTPAVYAGKGRVQLDVIFGAVPMSEPRGYKWDIFDVSGGYWDSNDSMYLFLTNEGQTRGTYTWELYWYQTNGGAHVSAGGPDYTIQTCQAGDYEDLVNGQAHTVEVTWQCGTLTQWASSNDLTVLSNGWIKLRVNGVTLIHRTGIPLIVNPWGAAANYAECGAPNNVVENVNRFAAVNLGPQMGGLCGIYDNLIVGTPETWVDVADYVPVELDSTEFIGGVATVRVATWAGTAGAAVRVRLQNITDDVTAGEGEAVTSTTPVTQTFTATLSTGVKRYRLQVSADDSTVDVFAMGQIQVPVVS